MRCGFEDIHDLERQGHAVRDVAQIRSGMLHRQSSMTGEWKQEWSLKVVDLTMGIMALLTLAFVDMVFECVFYSLLAPSPFSVCIPHIMHVFHTV